MTLTQKETSLLKDLKSQEELCIEKYGMYASRAADPELCTLFRKIESTERSHLDTVNRILGGEEVAMSACPSAVGEALSCTPCRCTAEEKKADAFLCRDALSMEKHVSGLYDTTVFEFSSPVLRDTLAHIQKEEQIHGEQIYQYMSCNNMYS